MRREERTPKLDPQNGPEQSSKEAESLLSVFSDCRVTPVPWRNQLTGRAVVWPRATESKGSPGDPQAVGAVL